jgi:hypothetical protein
MVDCPECGSFNTTKGEVTTMERQDDEHGGNITEYECDECKCKFEVTELCSFETEVTEHGNEAECEECDGSGYENHGSAYEKKCETCKGTGKANGKIGN